MAKSGFFVYSIGVPSPDPEQTVTAGPEETRALAASLADRLVPGDVVALYGDLGAGKTCFVQGLADAFGVTTPVNSPTYTLINEYPGRRRLVHFDLYRVNDPEEIFQLGWEEFLEDGTSTVIVEWAERAGDLIPPRAWRIRLEHLAGEDRRQIEIHPGEES